ncbi:glucosyltransferase domain-containing protein [Planococcus donghaensis]|uniref:Glucosyl transferase GtrII n=1 Tax=Planococcus donghaensis TaxID=414778 RepID=A0A1C7EFE6_9BACL|nr:glucosyltransferase domain-containing protein [Planococcus donghaensis]ANU22570.1 hypothetical protein BCM40_04015 [Planococcus donghaensis]
MPEEFLLKLKSSIKPQWKTAFITAFITGFLCHMFVFTNTLPNHDSLINTHSPQLKADSGRFFLSPFSGISSYFDLPWINGMLAIFYLALLAVMLIELFQLKKTFSILAVSGLVVTFPTIASTFSYMFTADGYLVSFLMTVSAILITQKYKYGFIPASILFYIGVGIYQANLPLLLTLILVFLVTEIMGRKITTLQLALYSFRFLALASIGMVLYILHFKLYTTLFAGNLTSYQGLDSVGKNDVSIFEHFQQIHEAFSLFFFRGFITDFPVNLFEWLNIAVFTLIGLGFILLLIQNSKFISKMNVIFAILMVLLMPLTSYILYFMSAELTYHMLMVFALVSFYLLPVVFYEHLSVPTLSTKIFSWLNVLIVLVTIFNFALISNIAYLNMELKYEKSTALVNRLISRIEQTENVSPSSKLAIIGRYRMDSTLSSRSIPESIPKMTGSLGDSIVLYPYHYKDMMQHHFGVTYEFASEQEYKEIEASEAFAAMEAWPSKKAVRIINNVVVVKLQN